MERKTLSSLIAVSALATLVLLVTSLIFGKFYEWSALSAFDLTGSGLKADKFFGVALGDPDKFLRCFFFFFAIGVVLDYVYRGFFKPGRPESSLILFVVVPVVFSFLPDILSAEKPLEFRLWNVVLALIVVLIFDEATHDEPAPNGVRLKLFLVGAFLVLSVLSDYGNWKEARDGLMDAAFGIDRYIAAQADEKFSFGFWFTQVLQVGVNFYLCYLLPKKLVGIVVQDPKLRASGGSWPFDKPESQSQEGTA